MPPSMQRLVKIIYYFWEDMHNYIAVVIALCYMFVLSGIHSILILLLCLIYIILTPWWLIWVFISLGDSRLLYVNVVIDTYCTLGMYWQLTLWEPRIWWYFSYQSCSFWWKKSISHLEHPPIPDIDRDMVIQRSLQTYLRVKCDLMFLIFKIKYLTLEIF